MRLNIRRDYSTKSPSNDRIENRENNELTIYRIYARLLVRRSEKEACPLIIPQLK